MQTVAPTQRLAAPSTKKYASSALWLLLAAGACWWPTTALARQNILDSKVAVGTDYDSNVFKSNADRTGEWKAVLTPELSFSSKGLTDSLLLTYTPDFAYNLRREDDELVHTLALAAEKGMSSRWKLRLDGNYANVDKLHFEADQTLSSVQNFMRADAATQAEIVRVLFPEIAVWDPAILMGYVVSQFNARYGAGNQALVNSLLFEGGGRQRYWSTTMHMSSEYEFADKSSLVLGYTFADQDYQSGRLADHMQQAPSVLLRYQFTPQWSTAVGYDLSFDSYDTSADSITNTPHLEVNYQLTPKNLLFWNYRHQQLSFEGQGNDTTSQGGQMGWKYSFDQRTSLTAALGLTFFDYTLLPDEREYNCNLGLSHAYERGLVAISARGLTAEADKVGGWAHARQSWEIGVDGSYKLGQDIVSKGRVSYGQWDSNTLALQNDYDRWQLGAGLDYGLSRWLTLALNYNYSLFSTDTVGLSDYSEHLVALRLVAAKELWRW